jgi:hypothetical protein
MHEYQLTRLTERAETIATALERIAEEVRGAGRADKIAQDPEASVATIQHAVAWGTANLNLDILINTLGDYRKMREVELGDEVKRRAE